jgi:hypothetical protein
VQFSAVPFKTGHVLRENLSSENLILHDFMHGVVIEYDFLQYV